MFIIRTFEEISSNLEKRKQRLENIKGNFEEDYLWICKNLSNNKIAEDHILLSYEEAKKYNLEYNSIFEKNEKNIWIFAETGQSDFWLIDMTDPEGNIIFFDHDTENFQNMSFSVRDWFVLADLIAQKEKLLEVSDVYFDRNLDLKEEYRQQLISEIEKVRAGLSRDYPFEL